MVYNQTSWLKWFKSAGISTKAATHYAALFEEHRMTQKLLPDLNKEFLKDVGITAVGDIMSILKHARSNPGGARYSSSMSSDEDDDDTDNVKTTKKQPPPSKKVEPKKETKNLIIATGLSKRIKEPAPPIRLGSNRSSETVGIKGARISPVAVRASAPKRVLPRNMMDAYEHEEEDAMDEQDDDDDNADQQSTVFSRLGGFAGIVNPTQLRITVKNKPTSAARQETAVHTTRLMPSPRKRMQVLGDVSDAVRLDSPEVTSTSDEVTMEADLVEMKRNSSVLNRLGGGRVVGSSGLMSAPQKPLKLTTGRKTVGSIHGRLGSSPYPTKPVGIKARLGGGTLKTDTGYRIAEAHSTTNDVFSRLGVRH